MVTIKKSIEIDAPVEEVYAFFSDPENLPAIWPSMISVSNIERGAEGARDFDWTYKMAGIEFHGRSENVEAERNERQVIRNESGIPSTFTYTYEAIEGGTRFTMEVEYEIPGKLLGRLAEPVLRRLNEREAETVLHNLKEFMEPAEEELEEEERDAATLMDLTRPPL